MRFFPAFLCVLLTFSPVFSGVKKSDEKMSLKERSLSKKEPIQPKKEPEIVSREEVKESQSPEATMLFREDGKLEQPSRASQTKLPLPRFVCIKSTVANMHVGPGNNYPIEWKYMRQFLPVEVIAEFEHWRQIRDCQGTVGWIHKSLLSSKRFVIVQQKVANLYSGPDLESPIMATVEPGVVAKVSECFHTMCKVDIQGVKGWIKRDFLFGVYPDEVKF